MPCLSILFLCVLCPSVVNQCCSCCHNQLGSIVLLSCLLFSALEESDHPILNFIEFLLSPSSAEKQYSYCLNPKPQSNCKYSLPLIHQFESLYWCFRCSLLWGAWSRFSHLFLLKKWILVRFPYISCGYYVLQFFFLLFVPCPFTFLMLSFD